MVIIYSSFKKDQVIDDSLRADQIESVMMNKKWLEKLFVDSGYD